MRSRIRTPALYAAAAPALQAAEADNYVTLPSGAPLCKVKVFKPGERRLDIPEFFATRVEAWGFGVDFVSAIKGHNGVTVDDATIVRHNGLDNWARGCPAAGSAEFVINAPNGIRDAVRTTVDLRFPVETEGPWQLPVTVHPLVPKIAWQTLDTVAGVLGNGRVQELASGDLSLTLTPTVVSALDGPLELHLVTELAETPLQTFLDAPGVTELNDKIEWTIRPSNRSEQRLQIRQDTKGNHTIRLTREVLLGITRRTEIGLDVLINDMKKKSVTLTLIPQGLLGG